MLLSTPPHKSAFLIRFILYVCINDCSLTTGGGVILANKKRKVTVVEEIDDGMYLGGLASLSSAYQCYLDEEIIVSCEIFI